MEGIELDYTGINKYLLLKPPFCFVDHVSNLVLGEYAAGSRTVTWNDLFFKVHYPDDPCMPGNLIAEAMGQILGFTILVYPENIGKVALLVSTNNLRLFKKVRPGDKLDMKETVLSFKRGLLKGRCEASVKNELVAVADITLMLDGVEMISPSKK